MTRYMRDSAILADIPQEGTSIAAGYANGRYKTDVGAFIARFPAPKYQRVLIDVTGNDPSGSQVLDVETGDAASGQCQNWIAARRALGKTDVPVIYCNRSTVAAVRAGTGPYILGEEYWLWVATLDGSVYGPTVDGVAGAAVACQYQGASLTGGNWDNSLVFADWWHANAPQPVPVPPKTYVWREYITNGKQTWQEIAAKTKDQTPLDLIIGTQLHYGDLNPAVHGAVNRSLNASEFPPGAGGVLWGEFEV